MIKSIQELEQIRKKALEELEFRKQQGEGIRVVVGMATCGIAAGARPVMLKFVEEIQKRNLQNVTVVQTGCIGLCKYEPIVEVYEPNKEKVTYVKMTPEKVSRVVAEHIVNGKPVYEYTIGYEEAKEANK
ncbi:(2Fe-2S) ferredoxin domain-containing protein [Caldicellulosiruptor morganii]|uniref:(2Fe-2S) ferredoxin domain-containing protein n=1 Tax=Caldicellulosiruptor morganii TaxID=1387555 RepID=A0ABY7BM98_9FIRM|nr:(2Fe-2S) ferredoxin domain-containing protein [Caldicellulosiruptor morganii]WAM32880.1 (2Fe-2S) ferredoxin domain-containing protein [Caldicellulosiruptor morganii]